MTKMKRFKSLLKKWEPEVAGIKMAQRWKQLQPCQVQDYTGVNHNWIEFYGTSSPIFHVKRNNLEFCDFGITDDIT